MTSRAGTNYLVVDVYPDRLELIIKEIDMVPSGRRLWQPGRNRPQEKVDRTPEMRKRGFVAVGKLSIDTGSKPRKFANARGYFLEKHETAKERGGPAFKGGKPLPRINLDGTISR